MAHSLQVDHLGLLEVVEVTPGTSEMRLNGIPVPGMVFHRPAVRSPRLAKGLRPDAEVFAEALQNVASQMMNGSMPIPTGVSGQ